MRLEKEIDEQRLDRRRLVADLVIARGRLARSSRRFNVDLPATGAQSRAGLELASQHPQHRVVAKVIVVVEVLIAQRDAEHALRDERGDRVLDKPRVPSVAEASRKPPDQINPTIGRAQKQAARVRRQRSAIELSHHQAAFEPSKHPRFCATLRLHRATLSNQLKSFSQNNFCLIQRPDAPHNLRNAG